MMQALIFSDSHGDSARLREALLRHPTAAAVCHLGDGAREAETIPSLLPTAAFFAVRGNCDMLCALPYVRLESCGGCRILMTHGHLYHVKSDLATLRYAAEEQKADIVLFGHTHTPFESYEDGRRFFNPGALRDGRYGLLDITDRGVLLQHMRL